MGGGANKVLPLNLSLFHTFHGTRLNVPDILMLPLEKKEKPFLIPFKDLSFLIKNKTKYS